jgi:tRNA pseudouridine32 synthase / 23S rRNA pseudouridine746 synthase
MNGSVAAPESPAIRVLFENDDLIAVDKPAGLASIPERNPAKISLLKILSERLGRKFWVVHRLDKQVSGVILFAKNAGAHRYLNRLFEQRQVCKTYLALVHGTIEGEGGEITDPLRRFGSGRMGADAAGGKACRTDYTVAARLPEYTLVKVSPRTGRKHQIRAHLCGAGHPIVGDPLYGERALQKRYPRLMLHAVRLELKSASGEEVCIASKLPQSFLAMLPALGLPPEHSAFADLTTTG